MNDLTSFNSSDFYGRCKNKTINKHTCSQQITFASAMNDPTLFNISDLYGRCKNTMYVIHFTHCYLILMLFIFLLVF
jgi:hypothetical protein